MGHTRNRRGAGSRLRADILAAATGLLVQGGERAVTLRAVAREVGIATPSIYPHFPDRSAVLLAVVRAAFAELARLLGVAAASAPPGARCMPPTTPTSTSPSRTGATAPCST